MILPLIWLIFSGMFFGSKKLAEVIRGVIFVNGIEENRIAA
ncbi:MAG: hypothetical protein ABIN18_09695 [Pseudomonadota bacterium]